MTKAAQAVHTSDNSPPAMATTAEAVALITQLGEIMEQLLGLVEKETELVRAGRLHDARALGAVKAELAREYMSATGRLKANQDYLGSCMPETVAALRERHGLFKALLQINLTVLATAHAVSESIMRGVSAEVNRKAAPQTYGASGRTVAPPRGSAQPLTVSRVL
jgi:hypothetical protein